MCCGWLQFNNNTQILNLITSQFLKKITCFLGIFIFVLSEQVLHYVINELVCCGIFKIVFLSSVEHRQIYTQTAIYTHSQLLIIIKPKPKKNRCFSSFSNPVNHPANPYYHLHLVDGGNQQVKLLLPSLQFLLQLFLPLLQLSKLLPVDFHECEKSCHLKEKFFSYR